MGYVTEGVLFVRKESFHIERFEYIDKIRACAKQIYGIFLDLLFPRRCPVCGGISDGICAQCKKKLLYIRQPLCFCCGRPVGREEDEYCADCQRHVHSFTQGRALWLYTGEIRRAIHAVKYQNKREYLEYFAKEMAEHLHREIKDWQPEVILPIPMHRSSKSVRGYNQAELLAVYLARELGIPVEKKALFKVRKTANQKELDHKNRRTNLKDAFAVELPHGQKQIWKKVLLVDDVYTTGSTLDEAARTLRKSGVKDVFFATICIVPQSCE